MRLVPVAVLVATVTVAIQLVALGVLPSWLRSAYARVATAGGQSVVAAAVVGGVLRLIWVVWATRTPPPITDPSEYLRIASELAGGISPRFGGVGGPSAFWPPGYPAVLTPFVAFAESTDWLSPAFAASLVNVVAGTVTIVLTARLATTWFGRRAGGLAAWMIALGPALIYFTATAHSETVFIALFMWLLVIIGVPTREESAGHWVRVGLLLGAACLVRTPALAAVAVPAVAIRSSTGAWRGATRATALVGIGAIVVLGPWAVRNGLQVGIWTPTSTNNAAAVCYGHHDLTRPDWATALNDPELRVDCFGGSPYADRRLIGIYSVASDRAAVEALGNDQIMTDEASWYRAKMTGAVRWAVAHPSEEVRLSVEKAWVSWRDEGAAVDGARNYAERGWAGSWQRPLELAADLWLWTVASLALVGLVRSPWCRRAAPVWLPIATITIGLMMAFGEPHYRYPANPLIAVLAAGFLRPPQTSMADGDARD